MENQFWYDLWERWDVEFEQSEVNPCLIKYRKQFGELANKKILVPLCGKSIDMAWFYRKGAHVAGVELSSLAIEAFFVENNLEYSKLNSSPFKLYQHDGIDLFCGDFFQLEKKQIGDIDIVYDRAALIALPEEMRAQYARKIVSLVDPGCMMFLITLEYTGVKSGRPPYSVTEKDVRKLYSKYFDITVLEHEKLSPIAPHLKERGITNLERAVYLLVAE